jgi:DNA-binding response OmpR family regulator
VHILYVSEAAADTYLTGALQEAGHVLDIAADPADGPSMAAQGDYQAILLDGPRPLPEWTARFSEVAPSLIVVVAARGDEHERAAALRAGADACFIRPLTFVELDARLKALDRVVRRSRLRPAATRLELLAAERAVRLGRAQVRLSVLEFRLLEHLLQHGGEVISLEDLRRAVWGEEAEPRPEPVHSCASRLRRKLASISAPVSIEALAGHGYALRLEDRAP